MMFDVIFIISLILNVCVVKSSNFSDLSLCYGDIPFENIISLHSLYKSCNGDNWKWKNTTLFGNVWSFDNLTTVNPCLSQWQGISCNCSDSTQSKIISINLSNYGLNGTLPKELFNLTDLIALNLENNFITSTIPGDLSKLTNIIELSLFSNQLSNSIPSSIGELTNLQYLSIYSNNLNDKLPSTIGNLVNLEVLYLFSNKFTGTVPSSLGNLVNIVDFWLYSNSLTGTIPETLGQLTKLQKLYLNHNNFYGTIPSSFANLVNLKSIDLSANLLIGQIPNFIINYPNLRSISMVSNCFTGTFPELTCNNSMLTTIVMDGLASSPLCPHNSYLNSHKPSFVKGFTQSNTILGTIPSCLWSMANLTSVHLSGNGLLGKIYDIPENSLLEDLSMSHNQIQGFVPTSIQHHSFSTRLDLSSNRITGTLSDEFIISNTQTILQLSVNRISGNIPINFYHLDKNMSNFNVLVGNRYSCRDNTPPSGDPNSALYTCASSDLDTAIYSWSGFLGLLVVTCLLLVYLGIRYIRKISYNFENTNDNKSCLYSLYVQLQIKITKFLNDCSLIVLHTFDWWNEITLLNLTYLTRTNAGTIDIRETILFLEYSRIIGYWSIIILICLLFLYLPFNLIINLSNNMANKSVEIQYGWVVSSAYLKGLLPLVYITITISFILIKIKFDCNYYRNQSLKYLISFNNGLFSNQSNRKSIYDYDPNIRSSDIFTRETINNFSNIKDKNYNNKDNNIILQQNNIIIQNKNNFWLNIIQYFIIPILLQSINFIITLLINILYVLSVIDDPTLTSTNYLFLQCFIGFFKFFWSVTYIPIATNILFHNKLHITTCMKNRYIMLLVNYILSPCIATLFQNESCFYYIFQPYSLINASFSDSVCNYSYVSSTQSIECTQVVTESFHASFTPPFLYSYHCGSALLTSYVPVLLYSYSLQGMLIPICRYIMLRNPSLRRTLLPFKFLRDYHTNSLLAHDDGRVVLDGKATLVTLMLHLTMLLTFGLTHPLLGFAVVFTILAEVLTHKLTMGKFLYITKLFENRKKIKPNIKSNDEIEMSSDSYNYPNNLSCISINEVMKFDTDRFNGIDDYTVDESVPAVNNPLHNTGNNNNTSDNTVNDGLDSEIGIELTKNVDLINNETLKNISIETIQIESQTYALQILESSNRDSWAATHACVWYMIFTTTFFWGFIFFDMISDDYGIQAGITVIIMLCAVLPSGIFICGRIYNNKYSKIIYDYLIHLNNPRDSSNTIRNRESRNINRSGSLNNQQENSAKRRSTMITLPFSQSLILSDDKVIETITARTPSISIDKPIESIRVSNDSSNA